MIMGSCKDIRTMVLFLSTFLLSLVFPTKDKVNLRYAVSYQTPEISLLHIYRGDGLVCLKVHMGFKN